MSISEDKYFKQVFNSGKDLIEKGLTDNDELERLGYYSSNGETTWMKKWWIPINWCCRQVQKEQLAGIIYLLIIYFLILIQCGPLITSLGNIYHFMILCDIRGTSILGEARNREISGVTQ